MTLRIRSFVFLALVAGTASACHKKPAAVTPAPQPPAPTSQPQTTQPTAPPVTVAPPSNTGMSDAERAAEVAKMKSTLTATIYFEYDRSDIRDDSRQILDSKVPVLQANTAVRIRVVGHTDERGSDEYNMALGQKRAATARAYLVNRGIAESRIDVVSFGESRPAMMGEGEASWSKNRRDEFEIVAGADQIRVQGR